MLLQWIPERDIQRPHLNEDVSAPCTVFMHLERHFDLSGPLQVPVSGAFRNLKPLVVFIRDNLAHHTGLLFSSTPKRQLSPWWRRRHSDSSRVDRETVHLVHILQLKYKTQLMQRLALKPDFLSVPAFPLAASFFVCGFLCLFYWCDTNTRVQLLLGK